MSVGQFASFKPSLVSHVLLEMEYSKHGRSREYGVDDYFYQKAKADGKVRLPLDTPDEQVIAFEKLSNTPNSTINYAIDMLEEGIEGIKETEAVWRSGDLDKPEEASEKERREQRPEEYQILMVERNSKWLVKIEEYAQTEQVEFVLVGLAHMGGPHGLIKSLEDKGYKIEKLI